LLLHHHLDCDFYFFLSIEQASIVHSRLQFRQTRLLWRQMPRRLSLSLWYPHPFSSLHHFIATYLYDLTDTVFRDSGSIAGEISARDYGRRTVSQLFKEPHILPCKLQIDEIWIFISQMNIAMETIFDSAWCFSHGGGVGGYGFCVMLSSGEGPQGERQRNHYCRSKALLAPEWIW